MRPFTSANLVAIIFAVIPARLPAQEPIGVSSDAGAPLRHETQDTSLLDHPARISFSGTPRLHALIEISKRAGVPVAFSPSLLPPGIVNCDCQKITVEEALERVLRGTGLTFIELGGQVVIQLREMEATTGTRPSRTPGDARGIISGRVVDAASGRAIRGALVGIAQDQRAVLTDADGRFRIENVLAGPTTLRARSMGFAPLEQPVFARAGAATTANFFLEPVAIAFESVVATVGSRFRHAAVDELTVPVDVYTVAEIAGAARIDMADALQELSPAINFNRPQIADLSSGVRPFQMRGLSPDHSLVLIEGKRRHPTAVVHVFGSVVLGAGSSGVDMNAIPSQALERLEILRDGAAAQYGSDAIAGVINLGLKNTISPPTFRTTYGFHTPGRFWGGIDGQRWEVSGNVGLPLLGRGVINLTGQVNDRKPMNRACPDPRDQVVPGDADVIDWENCAVVEKRNPIRQPTFLYGDGRSRNYMGFLNAELPLTGDPAGPGLYAFGGVSFRRDLGAGNFRRAIQNVNWPTMYPEGFLPMFDATTRDITAVTGIRGIGRGWEYDFSVQMGQNTIHNVVINSLNTSLGPCFKEFGDAPCAPGRDGIFGTEDDPAIPNQTTFDTGALQLSQYSIDLSVTRPLNVGLSEPANLAVGSSFRAENYRIVEGELASYVNGGHLNQNGEAGAAGSQVFFGFTPSQAINAWRGNLGAFGELELTFAESLRFALAGRFENYSDFGSTLTGKVAARAQVMPRLSVRATAGTGFRAPALSQRHYTHVSTTFRTNPDGQAIPIEIGEFPVDSPVARALGAKPLHEETSHNFSIGFSYTPFSRFTLTADAYLIRVFDRITLSNSLNVNQSTADGRRIIEELLAPYAVTDVRYFMNAFNTEVTGIDLTARYQHVFTPRRSLQGSLSYNFNSQELVGEPATPPVLAGMGTSLYPPAWRIATTKGRPRDRLNATARYDSGPISARVTVSHYGEITSLLSEDPYVLRTRRPRTIHDVDLSYEFQSGLNITVGVENAFNVFPDRNLDGFDAGGRNPYPGDAWGRNGRFLYSRAEISF